MINLTAYLGNSEILGSFESIPVYKKPSIAETTTGSLFVFSFMFTKICERDEATVTFFRSRVEDQTKSWCSSPWLEILH